MKKLLCLAVMSLLFTGCSFLPRINFGTPGTVPQQIDRSKRRVICKGEILLNPDGTVHSCSSGFQEYSENYHRQERRMTIVERIKSFINNLVGWGFWGFVLLLILCPSLIGVVFGRLIEGTIGITGKSLRAVVSGVQKARKTGKDLNDALDAEEDNDVKKYIKDLKEKENIK
jgi:hypothetical protein